MNDFFAYAQFEEFWKRFQPDTPFGRDIKELREMRVDARVLRGIWDRTESALDLLENTDDVRLQRISHHLKRIPRYPDEPATGATARLYDEVEIFQVKKFLHNYRCLVNLLPCELTDAFGLEWRSDHLEEKLGVGHQAAEFFYVSDEYSPELRAARAALRDTDERMALAQRRRVDAIEARWRLSFGGRDFAVVDRKKIGDIGSASDLLLIDPHDDHSYVVRPRESAEELLLAERRAELLVAERRCEDDVLGVLSEVVSAELPTLAEYRERVRDFDLAMARARLVREYGLTRPVLTDGPVEIVGGRFVPCEEACKTLGIRYHPLDAVFDTSVTVIFGSNMGGKTIVMKTVAFLQLCVQTGLFVPATRFATRLFEAFHFVGEGCVKTGGQGLSGFGFEIRLFNKAWDDLHRPTMVLFDEFGRTTHSREAEALISAAIEAMAANPRVAAFFCTHFRGVRRFPNARYLRMMGLDREGLDLEGAGGAELEERIRLIDRHMTYHLIEDDGAPRVSDAIAVATLLGVDAAMAARADHFFMETQ